MKKTVTLESVKQAIMELVADGEATTLEAIRLKTGGSLKIITEYRRLILGGGGESQKNDLSQA
jgi:hypothetical protein